MSNVVFSPFIVNVNVNILSSVRGVAVEMKTLFCTAKGIYDVHCLIK